jgi:hypothetical protein
MDGTAGGINPGPYEVLGAGNVISSNGSLDDSFLSSIERNSSVERNSSTSRIIFEREEESFDFPSAERSCFVFLDLCLFRSELALCFLLPLFFFFYLCFFFLCFLDLGFLSFQDDDTVDSVFLFLPRNLIFRRGFPGK